MAGGAGAGAAAGSVVPGVGTLIGAGVGALGSAVSGVLGNSATKNTNKTNLAISRQQMAFQERMSNTAHQRETSDLVKAGLNPILSATGGSGASSPAGASATMQSPDMSYVGKSLEGGITNALNYQSTLASLQSQKVQNAKTTAETLNTIEQGKAISESIKGQQISNAKATGTLVPDIDRARYESQRSQIAKQREDAEGKFKQLRAHEDEKNVWWDKKSEQAGELLDNITSGLNIFKLFRAPKTKEGPSSRSSSKGPADPYDGQGVGPYNPGAK